jgi:hypothetical protein
MRSIGKVKIKKLKKIIADMYAVNHNVTDQEVLDQIPSNWYDTWESAWSEINRLVSDELWELNK